MLRNLDFRGFNGQGDVKKAKIRGLIAKIGNMKPICRLKPDYGPFSWVLPWELCLKVYWRDSKNQKVRF